jgi:threonine dehydratase
MKEELFQRTGSFKPRGALTVMLDLDTAALARGVTGVSAGNHAISLAYSARCLGTTAKVVMPRTANAFRVQVCREFGAEVELVADVHVAFERVRRSTGRRANARPSVRGTEDGTRHRICRTGIHRPDPDAGTGLDAVLVAAGGGG